MLDMSKDELIALFSDLLDMYMNDKNSSTLREFLTVSLAGYTHNTKKIGFDGFKQDPIGEQINCEAKPKNVSSSDYAAYEKGLRKKPQMLNGGGNFTDYTWARFAKDKESGLNMLISGFIDGRLVYLIEVPFNHTSFLDNLEKKLLKRFPERKDKSAEYLRTASFTFKNYKDSSDLKVIYLIEKKKLIGLKKYINKDLFNFLQARSA